MMALLHMAGLENSEHLAMKGVRTHNFRVIVTVRYDNVTRRRSYYSVITGRTVIPR
jgi:hypothetical protein